MLRHLLLAVCLASSSAAFADGDELAPVRPQAVIGHAYFGDGAPSLIRFINVRSRPVRILWIGFDGSERPYAELAEGQEIIQPTFVAHRWVVKDAGDGTPVAAFISTRSAAHDDGIAQIAVIR